MQEASIKTKNPRTIMYLALLIGSFLTASSLNAQQTSVVAPSGNISDNSPVISGYLPTTINLPPGLTPEDKVLSEITIKNNHIHNSGFGVNANDLDGSVIFGNLIRNNSHTGIEIRRVSTGNRIKSNLTSGNTTVDLTHGDNSTPNTWKNNSCGTKFGADIPNC